MESFNILKSKDFDPNKIASIIKDFYENTSSYNLNMTVRWNPLIKPLGKLYRLIYADIIKQTMIPLDSSELQNLDSWIELIDLNQDNIPDYRCWIRVIKETGNPVYVGAYRVYKSQIDNNTDAYISVAFPMPFGSITTVLSPFNYSNDGLLLTTKDKISTESGLYFVFPGKSSYSMIPAFGLNEEFILTRQIDKYGTEFISVSHECSWLGINAFTMRYKIYKK